MRRNTPLAAAAFLLPFGTLFTVFVIVPVLFGFWISLHRWHVLDATPDFVALKNYGNAVRDDLFWFALTRTALFVLLVVPVGNALSLLLAVILNQKLAGTTFYKVAFYLPVLLSVAVVAVLWRWLYSADYGLINHYLNSLRGALGMPKAPVPWIGDPQLAMPSIAIMSIWWGAGGNMLIYLAALKAVPRELMEAAELDGATGWVRFWRLVIPIIQPVLLFGLVMSVIGASQVFGQSYIMTGGGPAFSTLTVVLYMYQQGFGQYQLGYASAVAYLLFLFVFGLTLLQFKLMGARTR